MVAQLVHWPLVLEIPGLIPPAGEKNILASKLKFLSVFCRDDTKMKKRTITNAYQIPPAQ